MAGNRSRNLSDAARRGRILARPGLLEGATQDTGVPPGLHPLDLDSARDGLCYVPAGYRAATPAPLVLLLHGAGGHARNGLAPLQPLADAAGLILLAPDSRRATWDVIQGGYGPDIAFIDAALAAIFARYAVDPVHLGIGGFSDGASYALSVGLTNGDLFSHILAFSPGFLAPAGQTGEPQIFISHGIHDSVLPIDRCSRRIVPRLRDAGYAVRYEEFDGPHTVPPDIARAAVQWFTPVAA
jgi:phospholipase/carboxylesterase